LNNDLNVVSQSAGLANVTTTYHKAASTDLASIQKSTRSLVEQGMKEDMPTGLTPRKRVWRYVDQWELTQSRDSVLQVWRQRRGSDASSDTFMNENIPLQAEGTGYLDEERDLEAMMVDAVVSDDSDVLAGESLASSESSATMPITQPPSKKTTSWKSGLPTLGTLTDRPTNVFIHHPSRKAW